MEIFSIRPSLQFGGLPSDLTSLTDLRRVVDCSVCSVFPLLLGWIGDFQAGYTQNQKLQVPFLCLFFPPSTWRVQGRRPDRRLSPKGTRRIVHWKALPGFLLPGAGGSLPPPPPLGRCHLSTWWPLSWVQNSQTCSACEATHESESPFL